MIKLGSVENKLKLESLKTERIEHLNEIVGGDTGMGMDEALDTCKCVKGSGCSVYVWADGTPMATGGTWNED